jgi:hypothetical protein
MEDSYGYSEQTADKGVMEDSHGYSEEADS